MEGHCLPTAGGAGDGAGCRRVKAQERSLQVQGAAGAEAQVRDVSSTCAPGVWLQEGVVWGNRPGKAESPVPATFPISAAGL